ncbi:unnamed protein product [Arabidopsis halleri]
MSHLTNSCHIISSKYSKLLKLISRFSFLRFYLYIHIFKKFYFFHIVSSFHV